MNIKLPDYFKLIDFENATIVKQVKYMLFFITVVAGLRKDMTPRIIAQRLNDQGINVSEWEVAKIMSNYNRLFVVSPYKDSRDRFPDEVSYVLTEAEKKNLIREVNIKFAKINSWKKPSNIAFAIIISGCISILLTIIGWQLSTRSGVDDLSWKQYKNRLRITEISMEERAKYFLYFITEHIKLREDMTPEIISERLRDADLGSIDPQVIKAYFESHPLEFYRSPFRDGAYKIKPEEAKRIFSLLELKLPSGGDSLSLAWIVSHVPLSGIITFFAGFGALVTVCVALGHFTANLAKVDKEWLLTEDNN